MEAVIGAILWTGVIVYSFKIGRTQTGLNFALIVWLAIWPAILWFVFNLLSLDLAQYFSFIAVGLVCMACAILVYRMRRWTYGIYGLLSLLMLFVMVI